MQSEDNCYEVVFHFSELPSKPPTPPSPPKRSPGEALLEKLYEDTDGQDVHFVFDGLSASDTEATESAPDTNRNPCGPSKTPALSEEPGTKCVGQDTVLGAHKLVLRQWPYFKTMFESGFSESGAGDKTIRIKDTSSKVFQLLLRFMYTGEIPEDAKPIKPYVGDVFTEQADLSWESLYLAAHRYDIQELCQIARDNIVASLNSPGTVQFLFRSAFLFVDLREPVIKHVAASCGATLASKSARETYMDHPESARIFGDLFEHIHAAKK